MLPRRLSCFRGSLFFIRDNTRLSSLRTGACCPQGQILVVVGDTEVLGERSEDASECYSDSIYGMVEEDGGAFVELLRLFRGKQS